MSTLSGAVHSADEASPLTLTRSWWRRAVCGILGWGFEVRPRSPVDCETLCDPRGAGTGIPCRFSGPLGRPTASRAIRRVAPAVRRRLSGSPRVPNL